MTDFTTTRESLLGVNLQLDKVEVQRITRYRQFWDYYLGRQWNVQPAAGEPQVTLNYSSMIVDLGWYYLLSKPPRFNRKPKRGETEENASDILDFLEEVWEIHNDGDCVRLDMGLMGGITGDVFVVVTADEVDPVTKQPLPEELKRVVLSVHDSSLAFPKFNFRGEFGALEEIELRHPWIVRLPVGQAVDQPYDVHVFREVITPDRIVEYVDDLELTGPKKMFGVSFLGSRPNPLGKINVVHIPNFRLPREMYGRSDLHDVVALNKEVNTQLSEVADILSYHAAPITVVKGARVSELQRSKNKVWGGIPADGDVKNLEMVSDLAGSHKFFQEVRLSMLEVARVPEVATGRSVTSGNMTGTALAMLYGPVLERAARKQPSYKRGFRQVNELILRIAELKFKDRVSLPKSDDLRRYHTEVAFQSVVPRNEKEELDVIEQKLALHLTSREQVWRDLGVEDAERLRQEIDEDMKSGIAPMPVTPGAAKGNPRDGQPPRSSNGSTGPDNPVAGTGRPATGGSSS